MNSARADAVAAVLAVQEAERAGKLVINGDRRPQPRDQRTDEEKASDQAAVDAVMTKIRTA